MSQHYSVGSWVGREKHAFTAAGGLCSAWLSETDKQASRRQGGRDAPWLGRKIRSLDTEIQNPNKILQTENRRKIASGIQHVTFSFLDFHASKIKPNTLLTSCKISVYDCTCVHALEKHDHWLVSQGKVCLSPRADITVCRSAEQQSFPPMKVCPPDPGWRKEWLLSL